MVVPISTNSDPQIDATEWQQWKLRSGATPDSMVEIQGPNSDRSYAVFSDIEAALRGGGSALFSVNAGAASQTEARVRSLDRLLQQMMGSGGQDAAAIEELRAQMAQQIRMARSEGVQNSVLARFLPAAGMSGVLGGAKASALGNSPNAMQTMPQGESAMSPSAMTSSPAASSVTPQQSVFPPAGWGGAKADALPQFNPSEAYLKATLAGDTAMANWEGALQNTNRGRQLMMLFFYFAKMAESGDMGAMYQFMKFITYIVSKDKAKQQIEMGKKLIELQDMSRQWTNRLMGLSTSANDPNASNELMKQMTLVKSETDAIATSQKLISQMMEEFAQVVETLTNTTKSALETSGRILRTVSTMR